MTISKKRLAEIAAIADEDIDTSDIPEAGEEFFKKAKLTVPGGSALAGASTQVVNSSTRKFAVPAVSVTYARNGSSTKANALGMRPMQERAYEKRGEQYLLIKSPPASGKSRALMFIALDKLHNQGLRQAIIVVPERAIGASFHDEKLSQFGFWADWTVAPRWNLCDAPGSDNGGKVGSVRAFLESDDKVLVCTHATFRFAVDRFGVEAFDDRLIAVDEFHHVSANPDNKLGTHLGQFIARDRVHIVAMTGSYFRGDAEAVLAPQDEAKFDTVTYTYYEQLNGYEYLKQLDIGYFFYFPETYVEDILKVLDPAEKTIIHIPNVNARESTKDKIREVEHIIEELGDWQGTDPATGFQLVKTPEGRILRIADLVDDDPSKRGRVSDALKDSGAEEQQGPCGHHHRPRHGEGGLRLDLVRARADGRLSVEPDRDRADHRPRHPRRAGQNPRPLHQPDRRARRLRRGRHRGRQRHAEGHRGEPPDGAGACAPLRIQA